MGTRDEDARDDMVAEVTDQCPGCGMILDHLICIDHQVAPDPIEVEIARAIASSWSNEPEADARYIGFSVAQAIKSYRREMASTIDETDTRTARRG